VGVGRRRRIPSRHFRRRGEIGLELEESPRQARSRRPRRDEVVALPHVEAPSDLRRRGEIGPEESPRQAKPRRPRRDEVAALHQIEASSVQARFAERPLRPSRERRKDRRRVAIDDEKFFLPAGVPPERRRLAQVEAAEAPFLLSRGVREVENGKNPRKDFMFRYGPKPERIVSLLR